MSETLGSLPPGPGRTTASPWTVCGAFQVCGAPFSHWPFKGITCMRAKSLQSRPTPCNPMDCSLPGFSVHGSLQARILEWVFMSSSGDLPDPWVKPASLTTPVSAKGSLLPVPPGKLQRDWGQTSKSIYFQMSPLLLGVARDTESNLQSLFPF